MTKYDWSGLNRDLLARCPSVLYEWFPAGKQQGTYFAIGNLSGDAGDSLKVSLVTGLWRDWAGGDDDHGDLLSLYARARGIGMGDAARELGGERVANGTTHTPALPAPTPPVVAEAPPRPSQTPSLRHPRHGDASASWCLRDAAGEPIHYVARYDTDTGKEIVPWTWDGQQWRMKGPAAPRPLYGLDRLAARPDLGVLVVEGEKCADVATRLIGTRYVCVTWTGGASAIAATDWTPVYGRKVLIWPDADAPGRSAAQKLAGMLSAHCTVVATIQVDDQPSKWDIADGDWADERELLAWMKKRVEIYQAAQIVSLPSIEAEFTSIRHAIESLNLQRNGNGAPVTNMANVAAVFEGHPLTAGKLWKNGFSQEMFYTGADGDEPIGDEHILRWTHWMQTEFDLQKIGKEHVYDGMAYVAAKHMRNPVKDYLRGLTWDGEARLDLFLPLYCGVPMDDYHCTASKNFWISLVARALQPGCQVHQMLVLYGRQGLGKTSLFQLIGGEWFATNSASLDDKDFFLGLRGRLILEIGEMDAFSKADIGRVKLIVSGNSDRLRDPYARVTTNTPRSCLLVGTVNEQHFLSDSTGNRRFVPVEMCKQLDFQRLQDERDQLFAEAVVRFDQGETWHIEAPAAKEHQEASRMPDPWETEIRDILTGRLSVTVREILADLKIESGQRQRSHLGRVYKALHALGWRAEGKGGETWRRE